MLHIYTSRRNFFVIIKISYLQPFREIMGGQTKRQFSAKNDAEGRKNDFFQNFICSCTSTHQDETFLLLSKFLIFSRLEKSWGDEQNVNFRLKMTPQAKKMTFFGFFSSVAHLHVKTKLFCYYQNFISSAVQRNHGGTRKKRYINERMTNDERRTTNERTTNYIDDDNSPPGFSESSG